MKILITGNCGFIGQNFVRLFALASLARYTILVAASNLKTLKWSIGYCLPWANRRV